MLTKKIKFLTLSIEYNGFALMTKIISVFKSTFESQYHTLWGGNITTECRGQKKGEAV